MAKYPFISVEPFQEIFCEICGPGNKAIANVRVEHNEMNGDDTVVMVCLLCLQNVYLKPPSYFIGLCAEMNLFKD